VLRRSVAILALAAVLPAVGCAVTQGAGQAGGNPAQPRAGAHAQAPGAPFPVAENQKPGTRAWRIKNVGAEHEIEGYADHVSVLPGQSFRLMVSTTDRGYRVEAFRMGWYGGAQARRLWESGQQRGVRQAAARVTPGTNMVTAPWKPSMTVSTASWPPGDYLLRLDASSGAKRYVPLTVRSPSAAGKVVLLNGVTTWQAYNMWGGYDLYAGPDGFADRARAVSFDRPYAHMAGDNGAGWFMSYDQPAVALAEKSGVLLAYETDADLQADPGLLKGARAVFSLGHDEYYSSAMRQSLMNARAAGVNIAFLGANAVFRHIRFASSPLGPDRVVICYKVATEDPLFGRDKSETTQDWRDPPDPRPESVLTGAFYECNPVSAPYVVYDARNWIFAGTGARDGTSFPGLVGPEYDRVNPTVPLPRPIQVLAHSPLTCDGTSSYADSAYYTTPSGAGVFAAGTMRWVCALDRTCGHGVDSAAEHFTDVATTNLLRVFATGPAGTAHPAQDNVSRVKPSTVSPGGGGD
jgi:hypothetical protein